MMMNVSKLSLQKCDTKRLVMVGIFRLSSMLPLMRLSIMTTFQTGSAFALVILTRVYQFVSTVRLGCRLFTPTLALWRLLSSVASHFMMLQLLSLHTNHQVVACVSLRD